MAVTPKDVKELRQRTGAPMMECKKALTEAAGDVEGAIRVLRERGIAKAAKRAGREVSEGVVAARVGPGNRGAASVMVCCETDFSARNQDFMKLADAALAAAWTLDPKEASVEALLEVPAEAGTVQSLLDETTNKIRENMKILEVRRFGGVCGAYTHFDHKQGALIEVELQDQSQAGDGRLTSALEEVCMHIVAVVPAPLAVDKEGIPEQQLEEEREIFIKQALDSGKPQEIAEKMVSGRMRKFLAENALLEQPFVKNPELTIAGFLDEVGRDLGTSITVKQFSRLVIGG